jgi:hypothetical protein
MQDEITIKLELTLPNGVTLNINNKGDGASISKRLEEAIEVLKHFTEATPAPQMIRLKKSMG